MIDSPSPLAELAAARAELAASERHRDGYSGNNPHKFDARVRLAQEAVDRLTRAAKSSGALERSDHEILEARLDAAFPETASRVVVDFEGRRYERRYSPATKSLAGNVMTWNAGWCDLGPSDPADA